MLGLMLLVMMPGPPEDCAVLIAPPDHNMTFLCQSQSDLDVFRACRAVTRLVLVLRGRQSEVLADHWLETAKAGVAFMTVSGTFALVPVVACASASFTAPVTQQASCATAEQTDYFF